MNIVFFMYVPILNTLFLYTRTPSHPRWINRAMLQK